jgi:uncharacterized membrane protein (DUF2068 family)
LHGLSDLADKVKEEVHRPDFGLRLIIIWKAIKAVVLFALGIVAFAVVHRDIQALASSFVAWLGIDAGRPLVEKILTKLAGLTPKRITLIGIGAVIYSCVLASQSWGLHRRKRWAEWLTVGVTSSLIPIEVYELIHRASIGKLVALIVNIAVVMYLLRHRWLFRR